MTKRQITEEQGIHKAWYEDAKKQTLATLPAFMKKLSTEYGHDYGTICHAVAASAVAAAWAMNAEPCGGITGFQGGAVFWEFWRHWQSEKGSARILKFNDLLYPQMDYKFDKRLSKWTWADLQKQAAELLKKERDAHPDVLARWKALAAGELPPGFVVSED